MYQLVLQFPADTISDYETLLALEEQLSESIGESAVDGHDMGSGEANIFILTADPQTTFRQVTPVLERAGRIQDVTAAYRHADEDRYLTLWPEDSSRQFRVA